MKRATWLIPAALGAGALLLAAGPSYSQPPEKEEEHRCCECVQEALGVIEKALERPQAPRFQLQRHDAQGTVVFDTATGRVHASDAKTATVFDPIAGKISEEDMEDERGGSVIKAR